TVTRPVTAFGLFAAGYADQLAWARKRGIADAIASFGPAVVDRAILDALCRASDLSFWAAMHCNLAGVTAVLCPDLHDFDLDRWLAALRPRHRIAIRHTIAGADTTIDERPDDGLPCTLPEILEAYGNRYFKIKIGADLEPAAAEFAK